MLWISEKTSSMVTFMKTFRKRHIHALEASILRYLNITSTTRPTFKLQMLMKMQEFSDMMQSEHNLYVLEAKKS